MGPNDFVLYRNENENLQEFSRCVLSHYKHKEDHDAKGLTTKVLWYLPILPKFKRLFSIKKDTSNLRWHADREERSFAHTFS